MSIQEDAVWPPERVDEAELDDTDLAKQQRENVDDPVAEQWAGIGEQSVQQSGKSAKSAKQSSDSDS